MGIFDLTPSSPCAILEDMKGNLRDNLILLKDGTLVDERPNFEGKPALAYKDGKWSVYSGDSGELFLGKTFS